MPDRHSEQRQRFRNMTRTELAAHQLTRLNSLLDEVLPGNSFYRNKLQHIERPVSSLEQFTDFPTTTKDELLADGANNLTFDQADYTRVHRTSGTGGNPLLVFDRETDWDWWLHVWQYILDAAQVTAEDRAFMAFSFGPFVGFWSAYDALLQRGTLVIPSGGLSTFSRLDLLAELEATIVCCTPTYALRMAEAAAKDGRDLQENSVRVLIVAGEPGGSLPAVRSRIEESWGAKVLDHSGATEVGPWGYGTADGSGLHVIESEFIAEFLPHDNDLGAKELVLTNLGRAGWPVIRYRTGDLVVPRVAEQGFVELTGGVLARADEMTVVRGVNIFPSAIEEIVRQFPEVDEFRIVLFREREMDEIRVELDGHAADPEQIATALQRRLGLRIEVVGLAPGALPRFEAKSRRLLDERT